MKTFKFLLLVSAIVLMQNVASTSVCSEQENEYLHAFFATDATANEDMTRAILFVKPPIGKGDDIVAMEYLSHRPITMMPNNGRLAIDKASHVVLKVKPEYLDNKGKAAYRAEIYVMNDWLLKKFNEVVEYLKKRAEAKPHNNTFLTPQDPDYQAELKGLAKIYSEESDKVIQINLPYDKNKVEDPYDQQYVINIDTKNPKKHSLYGYMNSLSGYVNLREPSKIIPAQAVKK